MQDQKPVVRFVLALIPSVFLILGHPFLPLLVRKAPAILYYPAVFLAAWLGGFVPGLISILMTTGYGLIVIFPQLLQFPIIDFPNFARIIIFVSTSMVFLIMLQVLRNALKKANEAVALRDDFLSLISHELKTPLTALKLNLNIVQHIQREENSESFAQSQIDSSIRQVNRLERLIVAMMDLTLFDSGQLILMKKNCDLKKIILEVMSNLESKTVKFIPAEGNFQGHWDHIRIEQIVSNILHNAIKYGHGKPIEIEIGSEGTSVWFSVRDQGPGIELNDQKKIYERFQRFNTCTDVQGLGLGLYLTKKLVEVHSGEITLQSKPGDGSLFKVRLPVA